MKKYRCEEMMCNNCVSRINKTLEEAGIVHTVDLEEKTVTLEGDDDRILKAVELLDDLGFSAVAV